MNKRKIYEEVEHRFGLLYSDLTGGEKEVVFDKFLSIVYRRKVIHYQIFTTIMGNH